MYYKKSAVREEVVAIVIISCAACCVLGGSIGFLSAAICVMAPNKREEEDVKSSVEKRSIIIAGERTSVSLEDVLGRDERYRQDPTEDPNRHRLGSRMLPNYKYPVPQCELLIGRAPQSRHPSQHVQARR